MSTQHFFAFIGATASLSTELSTLERALGGLRVVAPALKKKERDSFDLAVTRVLRELVELMRGGDNSETARLSLWAYDLTDAKQMDELWRVFGASAWIEFVPRTLVHKDRATRVHIEQRIKPVQQLLHEISGGVYKGRKRSPLPLPLQNFESQAISLLKQHWYHRLNIEQLRHSLNGLSERFRQAHTKTDRRHCDDRGLYFSPAENNACHGKPHPIGSEDACFLSGRFRFGAALYPGFHYDVRDDRGSLTCTLRDCAGRLREMRPERRAYINIFPNNHLLPE